MVISVGGLRSQRTDEEGVLNVEGARMVVRAGSMDSLDCPQSESMTYAELGSARNAMACCSLCLCSLVQLCTVSRSDGGIFDRWGASGSCWICRQTFEAPSVWSLPEHLESVVPLDEGGGLRLCSSAGSTVRFTVRSARGCSC